MTGTGSCGYWERAVSPVYTKSLGYTLSVKPVDSINKNRSVTSLTSKCVGLLLHQCPRSQHDLRGGKPIHILVVAGMPHPNRKGSLRAEKSMVKE